MAIISKEELSRIEIIGKFKNVQVKVDNVILDNGVEIARTSHRHVIAPGDDYSQELQDVQAACQLYHNQDVIDAYSAFIASHQAR